MTTPIWIEALVAPSERPGLVAAAEQLSECLSQAAGETWPVRLNFGALGTPPQPSPADTVGVVVMSLLPAVGRLDEPLEQTVARLRGVIEPVSARGTPLFLCTVFRAVRDRATSPGKPSPLLERIRRLNLQGAELSRELGVMVVDVDRALAHVGAQTLRCDYRLGSQLAAEVVGHQVVWSLLSFGLDDAAPPEVQEQAKAFHGDLQQINTLVRRRLAARQAKAAHG